MSVTQTPPARVTNDPVVVLRNVDWETYERLREDDANYHIKMTYNEGVLYLMSPSRRHERVGELLAQFVIVWTEEHDVPRMSGGSTTMKSELRKKGLEPDKCFYIRNEEAARTTDEYDADTDPPPDLVIGVDVTSMSTAKYPIYAAFGVPEIWRWNDERIEIHRLADDEYRQVEESEELPEFPIAAAHAFLAERHAENETLLIRRFREELRKQA